MQFNRRKISHSIRNSRGISFQVHGPLGHQRTMEELLSCARSARCMRSLTFNPLSFKRALLISGTDRRQNLKSRAE